MITLLSPAKTLDFESPINTVDFTQPRLLEDSEYLIGKLKKLSARQIGKIMSINPELAELNFHRFQSWSTPFLPENSKPAVLVFRGDVYRGLSAEDFGKKDLAFAQDHVRILSGLYGLLRPMDLIQPYRLEMGVKWAVTPAKKNLYKYWGDNITDLLQEDLDDEVIINCASNEYFKSVNTKKINATFINCHFRDLKNGEYKPLTTYAKLARGYMARFIVKNKINNPEDIKAFDSKKYGFNARLSSEFDWVFTRDEVEL